MPGHREQRFLPHSAEQMFDLVADVRGYAQFLPWVSAVRVRSESPDEMVADLIVGFRSLRERFTSKVNKDRPHRISVEYIDGPLKFLRNDWHFSPAPGGCTIDFTVDFAFKNRIFEAIAGQMFDTALRRMINAFEQRAAMLYAGAALSEPGNSSSSAHSAA
jgi:coenzyme Q-binding protein COQ10